MQHKGRLVSVAEAPQRDARHLTLNPDHDSELAFVGEPAYLLQLYDFMELPWTRPCGVGGSVL